MKKSPAIGKLLATVILVLLGFIPNRGTAQDQTWSVPDLKMVLQTLDGLSVDELAPKLQQWIEAEEDSTAQLLFVQTAFDHYASSPIMGYEQLALLLADQYLLNGRFVLSEEEEFQVLWYTQITRPNRLGATAPDLLFSDPLGYPVQLNRLPGDYLVLLFVDDQCPVCQQEYETLAQWLEQWMTRPTCELSLVRCYVGDDRERWSDYIASHPLVQSDSLTVWEAWDPDFNTGFQIQYGVVSTPKMFLINAQDIIVGRNLRTEQLAQLMNHLTNPHYRQEQLNAFFDQIFELAVTPSGYRQEGDSLLVQYTIDRIYEMNRTDTTQFKEVFLELYQYLKQHKEYVLQEGAVYLGEKYMTGMPAYWSSELLEEVAFAGKMFRRNPLGKTASDLKLSTLNGSAYRISDSPAPYTVLYFYKTDCAACDAFTLELEHLLPRFGQDELQLLAIYTGRKGRTWKKYAISHLPEAIHLADLNGNSGMFERYNLSGVPVLYLLDQDKKVIAKDIPPVVLEEILNAIYPK